MSEGPVPVATPEQLEKALKEAEILIDKYMNEEEAEAFREPVRWKEWELHDYPVKIKEPMDLGTIKKKLENKGYTNLEAFLRDVKLVWSNCQIYNASKSQLYKVAGKYKRRFERDQIPIQRIINPNAGREASGPEISKGSSRPTAAQKAEFCKNLYEISQVELGRVIQDLDASCKKALEKKSEDDLEINVDSIDMAAFTKLDDFVRGCIEAKKKREMPPIPEATAVKTEPPAAPAKVEAKIEAPVAAKTEPPTAPATTPAPPVAPVAVSEPPAQDATTNGEASKSEANEEEESGVKRPLNSETTSAGDESLTNEDENQTAKKPKLDE